MATRSIGKIQETLDALNPVQGSINELLYYKKKLQSPNHSNSLCSSVSSMIDTLNQQHSEVVDALIYYGNAYVSMDTSLAYGNNPEYAQTVGYGGNTEFTYTQAPEHKKSEWEKFWNQIIFGEFSEDVTWQGVAGNVVTSLVAGFFGVDAPLDIRDAAGDFSKGEWGWGIVDCLFLLPVIGSFKSIKYAKYADEVVDVAEPFLKYGDDLADAGAAVIKHGDNIADVGKTIIKQGSNAIDGVYTIGGKTFNTVDGIFSGVKQIDEIAIPFRQSDKVLWQTSTLRKYVLSDDTFKVIGKLDTIDTYAEGVRYLPDFKYIKKSDVEINELRNAFNNSVRADFVKKLATENVDDLKKINLTDIEIELMKKEGRPPTGFEVHHKLSLFDGGDNSFENLILINSEYHNIFTSYQNTFTKTKKFLEEGYAVVDWVIPTGSVYLPQFRSPLIKWGN